jgi:hypothetical protein
MGRVAEHGARVAWGPHGRLRVPARAEGKRVRDFKGLAAGVRGMLRFGVGEIMETFWWVGSHPTVRC